MFVVFYGSRFDHVLSWWKHKDDPNVLLLKYEDMKKVRESNCFQVRLQSKPLPVGARDLGRKQHERTRKDNGTEKQQKK